MGPGLGRHKATSERACLICQSLVYRAVVAEIGTRTPTPLRDVPQAATVVTRAMIADQSMQSLGDVLRYVPGVGTAQGEGNRDAAVFRGSSTTGDFFVDGLRDDVQYYRDLYNVERVEVLKGPNAMLFGRGGAGGVLNRATRQADWTGRENSSSRAAATRTCAPRLTSAIA